MNKPALDEAPLRPTPTDIEAVINDIRAGVKSDEEPCELSYWVDIIDPNGAELEPRCGGRTALEAAATAWVWQHVTEGHYDHVPRHVPAGWTFVAWVC